MLKKYDHKFESYQWISTDYFKRQKLHKSESNKEKEKYFKLMIISSEKKESNFVN